MEIKDLVATIIIAGICINASFSALSFVGLDPKPLEPWDATQFEENMNATSFVDSMGSREDDYYGNIIDAIKTVWGANIPIIEGFTAFMANMGVPDFIIDLFKIPWRVILVWSLFYLWRGG